MTKEEIKELLNEAVCGVQDILYSFWVMGIVNIYREDPEASRSYH